MTYIKTFLLLAVSLVASVVQAQDTTDWGLMVPDTEYEYPAMKAVQGYYVPEETGPMRCYYTGGDIHLYSDEAHEEIINYSNYFFGSNGEKVRLYSVEAGKPVYFYNGFPLDAGTFRFTIGTEKITLNYVSPSPEAGNLSISSNYRASIMFNIPVKCSKCKMEVGTQSAELTPDIDDSLVVVNWFATLRQWYREGKIAEGDILTLTLTGIRDVNDSNNRPDFGDGAGKLVLKFTMAGAPAELIRESGTPNSGVSDFKTYYLPDGDEGLVTLTFDTDLDPDCHPVAEIQYGDPNNIELGLYFENPPVKVEGPTVTVDLRGVKRLPEDMVPGLKPMSDIALRVSGIKTPDGQYVLTGSVASPYSFGFSYNLLSVVYSIAADWMPASGSALEAGQEMEIWVLNGNRIAFSSVDFSYLKDGVPGVVSVPYDTLRVETDPYTPEATLYYLSAPSIDADPDSEISVSFGGLLCADGLDHSSDIVARYKATSTAVEEISAADSGCAIFDLTGRRVLNPMKGIYIRDGRKFVVR